MSDQLIGRKKEIKILQSNYQSLKSEFLAVYGRRRVGKTFLIREFFQNKFDFYTTGIANVSTQQQLIQFQVRLSRHFPEFEGKTPANNWFEAFDRLIVGLENIKGPEKKVIFLDELPWLDTRGSNFLSGLEHFWNSWASARKDILLIVCGSSASWMIKHLLRNRGGLHNRVTEQIRLEPFNLYEVEQFLLAKNIAYDRYQIVLLYMVLGGIPFYLDRLKPGLSATQNINQLCFTRNAPFRFEFDDLYASLFSKAERHVTIIETLSNTKKGITRKQLIEKTNFSNGGNLTRILKELEASNFIRAYRSFGKKQRESIYQLVDMYSLFYLNFIKSSSPDDENFWINALESPRFRTWSGYAFEMVCLHHIPQIKQALGISGVQTSVFSWHNDQAQIDLVIDRKDQVVNLCEMKFSIRPFTVNKSDADKLRDKIGAFREATQTRKALFLTMVTTYGIAQNKHSYLAQNVISMDDLFVE